MGMWGLSPNSPCPHPYTSQANHYLLLQAALTRGGTSPRPLIPIFEPGTASHAPAAGWSGAIHLFANLANLHPSRPRRTSRIMARVFQHLAVGKHRP